MKLCWNCIPWHSYTKNHFCGRAPAPAHTHTFSPMQEFLAKDSMDDLVSILTRAKVVNRMLDFMPQSKRTPEEFQAHYKVGVGSHHMRHHFIMRVLLSVSPRAPRCSRRCTGLRTVSWCPRPVTISTEKLCWQEQLRWQGARG